MQAIMSPELAAMQLELLDTVTVNYQYYYSVIVYYDSDDLYDDDNDKSYKPKR